MSDRDAARAEDESAIEDLAPPVDLDGLLVALVLVPHSYSRNRFFSLFRQREASRVRRRAALLRSVIAELVDDEIEVEPSREGGRVVLRYDLPELGARRESRMSEDEFALVDMVVRRSRPGLAFDVLPEARDRIAPALERLFAVPPSADES